MSRKWMCGALACLLLLAAGCQKVPPETTVTPTTQPSHVHDFGDQWLFDAENHWQTCSCGQSSAAQNHTFTEGSCTTCDQIQPQDPTKVEDMDHWNRLFADDQFENATFWVEVGTSDTVFYHVIRIDGEKAQAAERLPQEDLMEAESFFCRLYDNGYDRWDPAQEQWKPYKTEVASGLRELLSDVIDDCIFEQYLLLFCGKAVYEETLQAYVYEDAYARHEIYVRDGRFVEWSGRYVNGYWIHVKIQDIGQTVVEYPAGA